MDPNNNSPVQENVSPSSIPPGPQFTPQKIGPDKKKILIIGGVISFILIIGTFSLLLFSNYGKVNIIPSPTKATETVTPVPTNSKKLNELVVLRLNEKINVPGTDLYLTYLKSGELNEECFDCISTTKIKIENGEDSEEFELSCGGITGDCINSFEKYGYTVEIVQTLDSNSIQVLIKNK